MTRTPTKTLRFSQEVLDELRRLQWSADGKKAVIVRKLNRPEYDRVNAALTAMGGRWSRKEGGHIFPADPRPTVEGLIETGTLVVAREGFFETPEAIVDLMLAMANGGGGLHGVILDAGAGMGAIFRKYIQDPKVQQVIAVEKSGVRALYLRETYGSANGMKSKVLVYNEDFLDNEYAEVDACVMNPPFENGLDIDFIRHAYGIIKKGGWLISLCSEGPFFRRDAQAVGFREWMEKNNLYSIELPKGSFKESGTGVNARVVYGIRR